ncbi:hypothetical protein BDV59DRAFT_203640 [Aspergillus ambiguus]|uniref:uncharacterized protein n=1 Tax=Aspergillus ambiguus TaxID=176160 RepID=UPI003CCDA6B6
MIFNGPLATALLVLAPSLAAASIDLRYRVSDHEMEATIEEDQCTNLHGLRGMSEFRATGKCTLYTFVNCIGDTTEAHRGPHVYTPSLIVGSLKCVAEDENADDDEEQKALEAQQEE